METIRTSDAHSVAEIAVRRLKNVLGELMTWTLPQACINGVFVRLRSGPHHLI